MVHIITPISSVFVTLFISAARKSFTVCSKMQRYSLMFTVSSQIKSDTAQIIHRGLLDTKQVGGSASPAPP